jgi:hypothetical protein
MGHGDATLLRVPARSDAESSQGSVGPLQQRHIGILTLAALDHAPRVECCGIVLNCRVIVRKRVLSATYAVAIFGECTIWIVEVPQSGVEIPSCKAPWARN